MQMMGSPQMVSMVGVPMAQMGVPLAGVPMMAGPYGQAIDGLGLMHNQIHSQMMGAASFQVPQQANAQQFGMAQYPPQGLAEQHQANFTTLADQPHSGGGNAGSSFAQPSMGDLARNFSATTLSSDDSNLGRRGARGKW